MDGTCYRDAWMHLESHWLRWFLNDADHQSNAQYSVEDDKEHDGEYDEEDDKDDKE